MTAKKKNWRKRNKIPLVSHRYLAWAALAVLMFQHIYSGDVSHSGNGWTELADTVEKLKICIVNSNSPKARTLKLSIEFVDKIDELVTGEEDFLPPRLREAVDKLKGSLNKYEKITKFL